MEQYHCNIVPIHPLYRLYMYPREKKKEIKENKELKRRVLSSKKIGEHVIQILKYIYIYIYIYIYVYIEVWYLANCIT
jgi:hypothetical protein